MVMNWQSNSMKPGPWQRRASTIALRGHPLSEKINRRRAIERPLGNLFEREKILYCRLKKYNVLTIG